jgi:DNA-directed RNA polymerase subunit delta
MSNKSLVQTAYEVLKKLYELENANKPAEERKSTALPFFELLKEVGQEVGIESEDELIAIASRFYTDLTLDGRFIYKGDNGWVLRDYEKYEDIKAAYNSVLELSGENKEADLENTNPDLDDENPTNDEETYDDEERVKELGEDEDEEGYASSDDEDDNY